MKVITFIVFCSVLLACNSSNETQEFDPPEGYKSRSGESIYQERCVQCHGRDGKQGVAGAKDLSVSKMDSTQIINLLKDGKNGMPRQMQHLNSDEEVSNLIDHIKSLRK